MEIRVEADVTDEQMATLNEHPVSNVRWVEVCNLSTNTWNPNSVATKELHLLQASILKDKFVMPITAYRADEDGKYIIVDGFHRYTCIKINPKINAMCCNMVPVSVIEKDRNDLMASTIRLNRARGSHSVEGMTSMVFDMLKNGWTDEEICEELGMEAEEIVRLKHITGFSKLFADMEYSKEWKTNTMINESKAYKAEQAEEKAQ